MPKRDGNQYQTERFTLGPIEHAQVTATTTVKLFKTSRAMRIDRVAYNNPTGLAADATNFFDVALQKGSSTEIAAHSTETGEEGTLTAGAWVDLALTAANADLAADDEIKLVLTEGGTATLPAGRLVIEGRYI